MNGKLVSSARGTTYYWIHRHDDPNVPCIVFTHGLTVNHHLFDRQIPYFTKRYTVLTWDVPLHGRSRPYEDFTYVHAAEELRAILKREKIEKIVLVGQSMGGYVCQEFIAQYPEMVQAFIAEDTTPFGLEYYSESDRAWLKKTPVISGKFPHRILCMSMAKQATVTRYGYHNCLGMMEQMDKKQLIHAMDAAYSDVFTRKEPISFPCPVLLLLGEKDRVGKVAAYNHEWAKKTGFPLHIIKKAGHNCNADNSEEFNRTVDRFLIEVLHLV